MTNQLTAAKAVIEFHPENFSMKGKIMGRHSAGNGFLEA